MNLLHIFRAGTFQGMGTETPATFSGEAIREIAESYDPMRHRAPIVKGHPEHDKPAHGWIKRLTADAKGLWAEPEDIAPEFAGEVRAGRYRKVSVAIFQPDHPNNPAPGRWHLKHVGFLGAVAPAVKGLDEPAFADDAKLFVVGFADAESCGHEDLATQARVETWKHRFHAADGTQCTEAEYRDAQTWLDDFGIEDAVKMAKTCGRRQY